MNNPKAELQTFEVSFHGRKRMWTDGGKPADWKFTIEATDEHAAEWRIRDQWEVIRNLVIKPRTVTA